VREAKFVALCLMTLSLPDEEPKVSVTPAIDRLKRVTDYKASLNTERIKEL